MLETKTYINRKTGLPVSVPVTAPTDDYYPAHDPREKPATLEVLADITADFVRKRNALIAEVHDGDDQGLIRARLNRDYDPIAIVKEHCRAIGIRNADMTAVMNDAGFGPSRFDGLPARSRTKSPKTNEPNSEIDV